MKKTVYLVLVILMAMFTFAACTSNGDSTEKTTEPAVAATKSAETSGEDVVEEAAEEVGNKEGMKIGITVYDLANPYFVTVVNGAQAKADELGIELIVNDPKSDAAAQVTALDNFIAMDVDAIIVSALDVQACEGSLQKAREQGIKIVSQSSKSITRDIWVSADEWDMGHVNGLGAGEWLAEKYGKDSEPVVAILAWDQISTQMARGDGMEDGIREFVPNAKIIRQDANTPAQGQSVTDSLLQANPDLTAIVCLNDAGAIGAYSAVQAANKDNEDFYIGSIDATQEAQDIIATDCAFRATVDLIPFENGGIDVELAIKLVNGEEVPETFVVPARLVTLSDLK